MSARYSFRGFIAVLALMSITILTSAQDTSSVERKVLIPLDRTKLQTEEQERQWRSQEAIPNRFAVAEEVRFSLANSGVWQEVEGGRMWRLNIHAPSALNMSVAFGNVDLPDGATIRLSNTQRTQEQGPYTDENISSKRRIWTAMIDSDEIVVELFVPKGAREPSFDIIQVNKGFKPFGGSGFEKSGSCNNNVACPEGDPWRSQIRSVAMYSVGGVDSCSGQLVNNTALNRTPYFLSANHCGVSASNDDTLVFYWDYQSPNCATIGGGSKNTNQTGSTFRASSAASDFLLVELAQAPPVAANVFFSGWDRSGNASASTVAIHHPSTDEKAISFNTNAITSTNSGNNTTDPSGNHWRVDDWEDGTTEGGSSGSCLWDANSGLCVGQLHGGEASCSALNSPDWYGKLSVSWTGGGTNATRLSNWLDPGSTGAVSLHGDPHLVTLDGTQYDFQGAGEYVALKDADGSEVQVRQSPIATTFTPGPNPYHGLATCVSLNSAVALRLGKHRITYQPRLDGKPDPERLELRIDGELVKLGDGIEIGGGIFPADGGGAIRIEYPSKYAVLITPAWWASQQVWYMNVSVVRRPLSQFAGLEISDGLLGVGGLVAPLAESSWLPALPDGSSLGSMPATLADRYSVLYDKFGESWRVTGQTSLFDYASGQHTGTFTNKAWPSGANGCSVPDSNPVSGIDNPDIAKRVCSELGNFGMRDDCVFDVTATGETGFAATYLRSQRLLREAACGQTEPGNQPSFCSARQ